MADKRSLFTRMLSAAAPNLNGIGAYKPTPMPAPGTTLIVAPNGQGNGNGNGNGCQHVPMASNPAACKAYNCAPQGDFESWVNQQSQYMPKWPMVVQGGEVRYDRIEAPKMRYPTVEAYMRACNDRCNFVALVNGELDYTNRIEGAIDQCAAYLLELKPPSWMTAASKIATVSCEFSRHMTPGVHTTGVDYTATDLTGIVVGVVETHVNARGMKIWVLPTVAPFRVGVNTDGYYIDPSWLTEIKIGGESIDLTTGTYVGVNTLTAASGFEDWTLTVTGYGGLNVLLPRIVASILGGK